MDIAAEIISDLIKNMTTKLLTSCSDVIRDQAKKLSIDLHITFKTYLKKSIEKYSTIKTLIYRDVPKELDTIYIPIELEMSGIASWSSSHRRIDTSNVSAVLEISNAILVEGIAGKGKSTLFQHMFIDIIKNKDIGYIPILIECKNLSECSVMQYLYKELQWFEFKLEEKYFEYALKSGCFILLFDGFDEIPDKNRHQIKFEIQKMQAKFSDNFFIVSSRPFGDYGQSWQQFTILRCRDLSENQAITLISKLEFDNEIKQLFISDLKSGLYKSHYSFASNPLLLTMMFLLWRDYGEVPLKKYLFYEYTFEVLFRNHDFSKGGFKRETATNLSSSEFKKIFSLFCFNTYFKSKYSFSEEEFRGFVEESISKTINGISSDAFMEDLCMHVCLILKDGLSFTFTHRSFQEYFTSFFIHKLSSDKQLLVCKRLCKTDNYYQHTSILQMFFAMDPDAYRFNVALPFLNQMESDWNNDDKVLFYFKKFFKIIVTYDFSEDQEFTYQKAEVRIEPNTWYKLIELFFTSPYRYISVENNELAAELFLKPGDNKIYNLSPHEQPTGANQNEYRWEYPVESIFVDDSLAHLRSLLLNFITNHPVWSWLKLLSEQASKLESDSYQQMLDIISIVTE